MRKLPWGIRQIRRLAGSANTTALVRKLAGIAAFAAILAGLLVAVQLIPEWQVKRASVRSTAPNPEEKTTPAEIAALQNEMRKTFIQVVGGAFAILALYFTYRRVKVSEQGHITDRYTKAIEQLGAVTAENKPNVEVRLGAIYALERIAFDSPRDHWTIVEVLTAYVRQNARVPMQLVEEKDKFASATGPSTEIQAILTVLGRRRRAGRREPAGQRIDLRETVLRRAQCSYAHLEHAEFYMSHLEGADFEYASLRGARFLQAHLEAAYFRGTQLQGADFGGASLSAAYFHGADLQGADFRGANLEGAVLFTADLSGANFQDARGLNVQQIKAASGWERATFDDGLKVKLTSDEPESAQLIDEV